MALPLGLTGSQAIGLGFNILGKLGGKKKKAKRATPQDYAAMEISKRGFTESRSPTPGQPSSGGVTKAKTSEEIYDFYRMVAKAKLVADGIDPQKGTQVGEFGTFKV